MTLLVELRGVTKRFGDSAPALDAVSGTVASGAITGLVGPDGAGKTTLIRLMAGLLEADGGSLTVLGNDPATAAASIHTQLGYMPQRFGLYEDLTVLENLTLYADLRALPLAERAAAFAELLAFTDLSEGKLLFDGPPGELTRRTAGRVFRMVGVGARRRAALAATLALPGVIDGVLQGSAIRVVLGPGASEPRPPTEAGPEARLVAVPPRFEDSFLDILGGGPRGGSKLAASAREVPPSAAPVVQARGLTKRFGDFTAAEDISFDVTRGEIFGLLGPNGAGKSTTFRMLCGLLRPTSGEGRVAGIDLRSDTAGARARLGYMAQKFSLYGDLSADQNLAFFAGAYGLTGARRREKIAQMVDVFSLGTHLRMASKELPLGFKQRLALACAVMHEPDALFLDEPTSGVDPVTRREFWSHINGLVEKGVSVVVTTHFMEEAEYCDRISLIYRGRSIAMGSPDELKARAVSAERPEPTMEDSFIALIEACDREAAAA